MSILHTVKDSLRPARKRKRVGRCVGSGMGKTSGRGHKGQGSRRGSTRRFGYEGGQMRLFMKIPNRGFSRARFSKRLETLNLYQIEELFQEGDTVSLQALRERRLIKGECHGIKILGDGEITKSLIFEVSELSAKAKEKIQKAKGQVTLVDKN